MALPAHALERRVQRGKAPEPALSEAEGAGVWGCPPDLFFFIPLSRRRRERGTEEVRVSRSYHQRMLSA